MNYEDEDIIIDLELTDDDISVDLALNEESPGALDHQDLNGRSLPNQHPISAITGLDESLTEITDNIELIQINKQDKLIAGRNIRIENNVISANASGGTWGSIEGNIEDQTDLIDKLNTKVDRNNLCNYNLSKYEDYLYSIHYYSNQLNYQKALQYFYDNFHEGTTNYASGACSAIRKDNYFARNYDWYYSEAVSFVVKKEGNSERYSSIGMAGGISRLSKEFVESGEWDDMYDILPFFLVDGINEHGVTITTNVVPAGDKGKTTGTHPKLTGDDICMLQLPSYILDKFSSAQSAVDWILNEAKIYAPYNEVVKEEMHFMIADKNDTFIVEFIDNEAVLVNNGRDYLTNFYLTGTELDENNKVNPETVTPYGQGLERYNIITENLDKEPREILELLKYTNAYDADDLSKWWMTEFVAPYADMGYTYPNLTVLNTPQDFVDCGLLDRILDLYRHRVRDGASTWQTVHGAVYDISKLEFTLLVQEEDVEKLKTFQLFPNTGDGKLIFKQKGEVVGEFSANQQLDTEIAISSVSSFAELEGDPYDNEALANALNDKQTKLIAGEGISITNNIISSLRQIYRGQIRPTDANTLIWIDTSGAPTYSNKAGEAIAGLSIVGGEIPTYSNKAGEAIVNLAMAG